MIKKFLLPHDFGSNTIWLMLSGLFLRIKATEDLYGYIKLPVDNYLFNLNSKIIDNDYQKFKNLHYVILDGPVEHLQDKRIKEVEKNLRNDQTLNFHYVGRFNNYWSLVKNSKPLFTEDYKVFEKILIEIKKVFPVFFHKYIIKRLAVTAKNIRSYQLSINHIFSKKKYVYFGYIKPNPTHLANLENFIKIKNFELDYFFKEVDDYNALKKKISHLCDFKENLLINTSQNNYPYLNELLLFLIRNILCNFLKRKNNFYIYDNRGKNDLNFNAYEMFFGGQHIYLDLGSKVGYDKIYPRTALLKFLERDSVNFSCEESFFFLNKYDSNLYLQKKFDSFLKEII